mmetsp:Transcript_36669/g.74450  ORF Transcript_36669/g.74450 Transcript_36669/m.74450 type:complete len:203 (+) Transcript_36669:2914-3522(+)
MCACIPTAVMHSSRDRCHLLWIVATPRDLSFTNSEVHHPSHTLLPALTTHLACPCDPITAPLLFLLPSRPISTLLSRSQLSMILSTLRHVPSASLLLTPSSNPAAPSSSPAAPSHSIVSLWGIPMSVVLNAITSPGDGSWWCSCCLHHGSHHSVPIVRISATWDTTQAPRLCRSTSSSERSHTGSIHVITCLLFSASVLDML